jgi:hypothetical protein
MADTRRAFLAAASAVGLEIVIAGQAQAQTPSPSPKATKAASAYARDFAHRMLAFDPHLSQKQLDSIAHQVDQLGDFRKQLHPKGHGLANGDPPSPQFRVSE